MIRLDTISRFLPIYAKKHNKIRIKNMKKIIIASDSTCDLGAELIERYGIRILPLNVSLGEKQYSDGVDIDPEMIYEHYEKFGELPKTSAPNISACESFFEELKKEAEAVLFFTISAEMSSTYSNACIAASNFSRVYVINTKNLSTGSGLCVVSAAEMAKEGLEAEEIRDKCLSLVDRVDASFVIENLEFLRKGGRCSALTAFGANLLGIKPCITVIGGKMSVTKKYRGNFLSVIDHYVEDRIGDASNIELDRIFVTNAGCDPKFCNCAKEKVQSLAAFGEILETRAGCTVSSHCGRNTLGVLFIRKQ